MMGRKRLVLVMLTAAIAASAVPARADVWDDQALYDGIVRVEGGGDTQVLITQGGNEWSSRSHMWAIDAYPTDSNEVYSVTRWFGIEQDCDGFGLGMAQVYYESRVCFSDFRHQFTTATPPSCGDPQPTSTCPVTSSYYLKTKSEPRHAIPLLGRVLEVRTCVQMGWPVPDQCSHIKGPQSFFHRPAPNHPPM